MKRKNIGNFLFSYSIFILSNHTKRSMQLKVEKKNVLRNRIYWNWFELNCVASIVFVLNFESVCCQRFSRQFPNAYLFTYWGMYDVICISKSMFAFDMMFFVFAFPIEDCIQFAFIHKKPISHLAPSITN